MGTSELPTPENHVFDVIGVGFGPSNIALAIAIEELNLDSDGSRISARFLEKQDSFGWHRGMLIEGATMQVPFVKDLVTMRRPSSRYGYLSYLHETGRLADFVNANSFFPLRVEFHAYLEWCAAQFARQVGYGCEVVDVRPVSLDGTTTAYLDVVVRQEGRTIVQRARNLVIAAGLEPVLPEGTTPGPRVWHSAELLHEAARLPAEDVPRSFVVVGAGQSAAEAVDYLHQHYQHADVHAVFARFGYSVADATPFTNRIFDPASVDHYFSAPPAVRRALLDYHGNTNYAVVDADLIAELYRRHYLEGVTGRRRLHFHNTSRVSSLTVGDTRVTAQVEFLPTGEHTAIEADAIVYATGYRPRDPVRLLASVTDSCKYDDDGRLDITRDYRVSCDETMHAGIYVQGPTETSHGISSGLLSNIAVRAGEILRSITRNAVRSPGLPG
ncbi:lysine N(6)-hydroxylase/L-ornithine N(5)-oxygenase family protein [Streptomyces sp. NBC_00096]|uniref:lysine N(6)-hydroxylase/L-ornithine N(5)-oxygenase family protein n=1 Tax=Streptomyces sp. NBC_00096 TaxID=2975650 RepID=UPI0032485B1D